MFITPQYDKSSKKQDYMDMQDDLLQTIIEKRRKKEQEKVDNLHFHKQQALLDVQEHEKIKFDALQLKKAK